MESGPNTLSGSDLPPTALSRWPDRKATFRLQRMTAESASGRFEGWIPRQGRETLLITAWKPIGKMLTEDEIRPRQLLAEQGRLFAEDIAELMKHRDDFVQVDCPA